MENKFSALPDDVRSAAIEAYQTCLLGEKAPPDANGAKLQKERLELLADNILAGFSRLTFS